MHRTSRSYRLSRFGCRAWSCAIALAAAAACGQSIRTDTSWGRSAQSLIGPRYDIAQTLGRVAGDNLFHSFQSFSIAAGESAVFSTTTPSLQNVIARVSGDSASTINGLLQLRAAAGSAPAFFFVNPAGVTFGAGGSVDVPGSFHVSTANYLKFADGTVFRGGSGVDSTFTAAAPEAFGFLGTSRASIAVRDRAALALGAGQPLTLVAGDIEIDKAQVKTIGADIVAAAMGDAANDWPLSGPPLSGAGGASGNITIANGGSVSSSPRADATAAGNIFIRAASLDIDGQGIAGTGVFSRSGYGNGRSGAVDIRVNDRVVVTRGAKIGADSDGAANAGPVYVAAKDITIDGQGDGNTGITSDATSAIGAANAGDIAVTASGGLRILGGGNISSSVRAGGKGGSIAVTAEGGISIDGQGVFGTGIHSDARALIFRGVAGNIEVKSAGPIAIFRQGTISSSTQGDGDAGPIKLTGASIHIDGGDESTQTGVFSNVGALLAKGNGGNIEVVANGPLTLIGNAAIASDTWGNGNAGPILVRADSITIDGLDQYIARISSNSNWRTGRGNAGSVTLTSAGNLRLMNTGRISSDTGSYGNGGDVKVSVGGNAQVLGHAEISANSGIGANGRAGVVDVAVTGALEVHDGAGIVSDTFGSGNAGAIRVTAGSIDLRSKSDATAWISSESIGTWTGDARVGTGNAGNVDVTSRTSLTIGGNGNIQSDTRTSGHAGTVRVSAQTIKIEGADAQITSVARAGSSGDSGNVEVAADALLSIRDGAVVASSTFSSGNAGTVKASADALIVDATRWSESLTGITSSAEPASTGNAGNVDVAVRGLVSLLNGGQIVSGTYSSGQAGSVNVLARELTLDGYRSAISSSAQNGSLGKAGSVSVSAPGSLTVSNGAFISSSTYAPGSAGTVSVQAGRVLVDGATSTTTTGIFAAARQGSGGQTGNVSVSATDRITLRQNGLISIQNDATAADPSTLVGTTLIVDAPSITLHDGGKITAAASGNVASSGIAVAFTDRLLLDAGSITTSANQGNGGPIRLQGGRTMIVEDSQITTSVLGASGNGGDIRIAAEALVLKTGFVQANTAALAATGGNVDINVGALIPTANSLALGSRVGNVFSPGVFGQNVIEAAAPSGIAGNVQLSTPALDVSGALGALTTSAINFGALGKDPCRIGAGSSFTLMGHGGLAPSAGGAIRPESPIVPDPSFGQRSALGTRRDACRRFAAPG